MAAPQAQVAFICPKCGGTMRSFERSGIVIEQCEDCRGIFLDHGELERFVDAEGGGWSGRVGPARPEWRPDAPSRAPGDLASDAQPSDEELARERRERARATIRDLFGEER